MHKLLIAAALLVSAVTSVQAQANLTTRLEGTYTRDEFISYEGYGLVFRHRFVDNITKTSAVISHYDYLHPRDMWLSRYGIYLVVTKNTYYKSGPALMLNEFWASYGPKGSAWNITTDLGPGAVPEYHGFSGVRITDTAVSRTYEVGGPPKLRIINHGSTRNEGNLYLRWWGGDRETGTIQWYGLNAGEENVFTLYMPSTWNWAIVYSITVVPGPLQR